MSNKKKLDELAARRTASLKRDTVQPVNILARVQGQKADKSTKLQVDKYTTHLRPATIKAIKQYALDHDLDDYEVVQQALDRFFQSAGG